LQAGPRSAVLEFELRTSHLLGGLSTTSATLSVAYNLLYIYYNIINFQFLNI
jgi:hypothetical protein